MAAQLEPGNPAAHFNLAMALLRVGGRNAEAVAQLQQVLRLQPGLTRARDMLAELLRNPPAAP